MPTCVGPMVPKRAQVRDTNILGEHHRTHKELLRERMRGTLGNHGRSPVVTSMSKRCSQGDESTFSQRFFAKISRCTPSHTPPRSTDAVRHWSVQLPAIVMLLASISQRPVQMTCARCIPAVAPCSSTASVINRRHRPLPLTVHRLRTSSATMFSNQWLGFPSGPYSARFGIPSRGQGSL